MAEIFTAVPRGPVPSAPAGATRGAAAAPGASAARRFRYCASIQPAPQNSEYTAPGSSSQAAGQERN
ncbi:MAG: hypothetical protein ABIQ08_18455, partial [Duganella sp.]